MKQSLVGWLLGGCASLAIGCGAGAGEPDHELSSVAALPIVALNANGDRKFYVPPPRKEVVQQVAALVQARRIIDAARITALSLTPRAVWFTGGTPADVEKNVNKTIAAASLQKRVPVLVAYNLPFRDCAQYSAGGALDSAAYEAWIDGFAAGIGSGEAVVLLEPDGIGIIPYHTNLDGSNDWCKPTSVDAEGRTAPAPGADAATRYAQLSYAVNVLAAKAPRAVVYLDGTHSGWLNVGEASSRLSKAGVSRTRGFFLNVANYQFTANLAQYGTWIASCLAYATSVAPGDFGSCPNQYWNGGPLPSKIAQMSGEWTGGALDGYGEWSDAADTAALNTSGVNLRYANMLGPVAPTARFVIDTSRNGNGPLNATTYAAAPYNQPPSVIAALNAGGWCNPPGAGLGPRPTANTGRPLLDAMLWIKAPGESDGSCDIAGGARAWDFAVYDPWGLSPEARIHFDPLRSRVDPEAGAWFGDQALELARLATPPLF